MTIAASLVLSVSLALQPDANLRLYNPDELPVDATVTCGGASRTLQVAPHDAIDAGACAEAKLDAPMPLVALETHDTGGIETQRLLGSNTGCETLAVEAPLFACARGTATVVVPLQQGATYAWSVDGASIISGHGTNRLVLTLGDGPTARVSATVTGACAGSAEAVIGIRNPLVVEKLEVPAAVATNAPVLLRWTYAPNAAPVSQLLTGDAFDAPVVLPAGARSYSWTPTTAGVRNVELLASYAPSISTKVVGRRRAVGKSRATASACPSGRATAQVEVRGCGSRNPNINAPDSVQAGETFTATVSLRTGETAKWTAIHGAIVSGANSDTVTVKAGDVVETLSLKATVTTGPSCQVAAERLVAITQRAVCATSAPTFALSVEGQSCNTATIKAAFTGTPPFSGMWSDGSTFQTSATTLTHAFSEPGTYTIRNFRDSQCTGTSTSIARVEVFSPSVTLTATGSCPGSTITATFTGTPPFSGRWTDGQWFSTSDRSITRVATVSVSIDNFRDSACPTVLRQSNAITIDKQPYAFFLQPAECTIGSTAYPVVRIQDGVPPYAVHWSDGVVSTDAKYFPQYNGVIVSRDLRLTGTETRATVTRITTGTCDATMTDKVYEASYRPYPQIDDTKSDTVGCIGKPLKMVLKSTPALHPDAKLAWTISNGEILSGQGTNELTYIQWARPAAEVNVKATYPDHGCDNFGDKRKTTLLDQPQIVVFTVEPEIILPGGTAQINVRINDDVEWGSLEVMPKSRESSIDFNSPSCTDIYGHNCTYTFRDRHGPGTIDLLFTVGNRCAEAPVQKLVTLRVAAQ